MAQKIQVVLEDDLDGGPADETVVFGLDGTTYEIDLNKKNASKLRDALAPWVGAGRRTGAGRGGARRARGRASRGSQAGDVRTWARENGYQVSERGRISAEIQAAYAAAH
ncbi:MAG TPA: Lsr2 family protein [Actinomycetes bacterium]|nr:Lsr2 family protein [Actinomycetes bacterium]